MMDIVKSWTCGVLWIGISGPVVVNLLAALLVASIALRVSMDLLKRRKLPPGPLAWPVVGNFPALGGSLPHRTLRILASKYGGLMYLRLGSVPTIVVSTVAVSKELFQTLDTTFLDRPKCMYFDIVTDGYKNMAVANGRYWRELRKLFASVLFTPKRLATYESARAEEIHTMMRELVSECQEGTCVVDLKSWLIGTTSNNMTRMLFNKRYFGTSADRKKEKEDFEAMIARMFELSGAFVISDFVPWLGFLTKWQGWQKKMEDLRDCIYDIGGRMLEIEEHRQRLVKDPAAIGVDENDANHAPDFLDLLLQTPLDNGEPLPDKNLILMVMQDLISAGTETSATAAEWALAELMRHPSTMQTLQAELTAVIGANALPRESHLPHLPFLHAVVKETLRLHPPAALNLPRESTRPFTFRGCQFPRGTRLVVNFFAIHRDAREWELAEEFKPERWFERDVSAVAGFEGYELMPFSAGRRMCPAAELGYMMVGLLVAHLVHGFEWRLPEGVWEVDMAEQFGLTVSMRTPLRLVPIPKHSASLY